MWVEKCEVGERAGIVAWRRGACPAGDCGMGEVKFVAAQGRMVERTEKLHIFAYQSLTEKGVSDENEKIVDKGIVAIG